MKSHGLEEEWIAYRAGFKAMANWVKSRPIRSTSRSGAGRLGERLTGGWEIADVSGAHLAHRDEPFRLQGSGKIYTYKLFLEAGHHLLRDGGRLGMLVPSGLYTDKGATALRKTLLERCSWEWCYGFENRLGLFPIHRCFKFGPIVVQRGGITSAVRAAFMRHDVAEWERPGEHAVALARRGYPAVCADDALVHGVQGRPDLELAERIYGDHPLLE